MSNKLISQADHVTAYTNNILANNDQWAKFIAESVENGVATYDDLLTAVQAILTNNQDLQQHLTLTGQVVAGLQAALLEIEVQRDAAITQAENAYEDGFSQGENYGLEFALAQKEFYEDSDLADRIADEGFEVVATDERSALDYRLNIAHQRAERLHDGDLTDDEFDEGEDE